MATCWTWTLFLPGLGLSVQVGEWQWSTYWSLHQVQPWCNGPLMFQGKSFNLNVPASPLLCHLLFDGAYHNILCSHTNGGSWIIFNSSKEGTSISVIKAAFSTVQVHQWWIVVWISTFVWTRVLLHRSVFVEKSFSFANWTDGAH